MFRLCWLTCITSWQLCPVELSATGVWKGKKLGHAVANFYWDWLFDLFFSVLIVHYSATRVPRPEWIETRRETWRMASGRCSAVEILCHLHDDPATIGNHWTGQLSSTFCVTDDVVSAATKSDRPNRPQMSEKERGKRKVSGPLRYWTLPPLRYETRWNFLSVIYYVKSGSAVVDWWHISALISGRVHVATGRQLCFAPGPKPIHLCCHTSTWYSN